jgi:hypothetical protein
MKGHDRGRHNRSLRNVILAVLVLIAVSIWPVSSQIIPTPYIVPSKPTLPVKSFPILPPVEYDHYYEGDLTINMVNTLEELYAACGMQTRFLLACSSHTRTACLITMVKDEVMRSIGWTTGLLLRHEIGHCNGWGADHAGQRAVTAPSPHWAPANDARSPRTRTSSRTCGPRSKRSVQDRMGG